MCRVLYPQAHTYGSMSVAGVICGSISTRSQHSSPAVCPFDKRQVPLNNEQ